jgi:hypothetical protein
MRRIGLAVGSVALLAGCGIGTWSPLSDDRVPAALMVSSADLPPGVEPGEDPAVFEGIKPMDPDCGRLLDLADGDGVGIRPHKHAVYYRTESPSSVVQRVVLMPADEASERVERARAAARGCPAIRMGDQGWRPRPVGADLVRLRREYRTIAGLGPAALSVRYSDEIEHGDRVTVDILMTPIKGGMLSVAGTATAVHGERDDLVARVIDTAVGRARPARLTGSPSAPAPGGAGD